MTSDGISSVLVANRGEIAVRVIRTCRELGIRPVAVFSDADRDALHVRMADAAYRVGPAPSSQSYLVQQHIIEAALEAGCDAVHPGYGFLSENAPFARACRDAGLIFIGPPEEAIRMMGDKTAARALMREAGVPMAPGTPDAISDPAAAAEMADQIGYPVLIKAAAGGGGKGMRIVERAEELERAIELARSEARSAFGDDRVFVEKFVPEPRHVEFQILADTHGNVVHLFERECSIQRRHQKVIEEAPSCVLTEDVRARMGEAAVEAARACGYTGAGTVEFLVDPDLNFYFMEMNTRLQVEHPVTEWITGIDLVAEQIRIAEGEALGYGQEDLAMRGHAIECRIYAEDPENQFLPDPGTLTRHLPPSGLGVRLDSGVETGGRVEIHYDPLISKLTTWGRTRAEAINRMKRALAEYEIAGVRTTIPFCRFVMEHPQLAAGRFTTRFVEEHFQPGGAARPADDIVEAAALAAVLIHRDSERDAVQEPATRNGSRWTARRRLD